MINRTNKDYYNGHNEVKLPDFPSTHATNLRQFREAQSRFEDWQEEMEEAASPYVPVWFVTLFVAGIILILGFAGGLEAGTLRFNW